MAKYSVHPVFRHSFRPESQEYLVEFVAGEEVLGRLRHANLKTGKQLLALRLLDSEFQLQVQ